MAAALAPPGDIGGITEETAAAAEPPPTPPLLPLLLLAAPMEFMTTEDPGLECCDDDPDVPDDSDVETLPAPFPASRRASSTMVHGCGASCRAQ